MKKKNSVLLLVLILLLSLGSVLLIFTKRNDNTSISDQNINPAKSTDEQNTALLDSEANTGAEVDKTQYSLADPTSIWVVVNKQRAMPNSYQPALVTPDVQLRLSSGSEQMQISKRIQSNVKSMFDAAKLDGVSLVFGSGYRSSMKQKQFYDSYVSRDGQAAADTYSARPGHSEHQTGLAFDVTTPSGNCHLELCFANTPQGKWLATNAHEYGFIIRYPEGKQEITGYQYEPWHIRFIGKQAASEVHATNQTLEEYFGLDPAPGYD